MRIQDIIPILCAFTQFFFILFQEIPDQLVLVFLSFPKIEYCIYTRYAIISDYRNYISHMKQPIPPQSVLLFFVNSITQKSVV